MKSKGYLMTERGCTRFKKWLVANNMSMSKFAREIGVSKQYVNDIVLGKRHVTPRIRELFEKGGYTLI